MTMATLLRQRLIIDCDPGQDDAINILVAFSLPERFDLIGITTVAGNVPVALTQRNARMICDLAGRSETAVYAGCDKPLQVEPLSAGHVHGETGIDGLDVWDPHTPLQSEHAVDFLVSQLAAAHATPVTIVATGPLTNLALALRRAPSIAASIEQVVMMGGAFREGGNITPSAEFNMRADPHAAKIVLSSGLRIVMIGLDVTHRMLVDPLRLKSIASAPGPVSEAAHDMLACSGRFDREKYGSDGGPLHDPCTMLYLTDPDLFLLRSCNVEVETDSALTLGHTAVDFWNVSGRPRNVEWAYAIDADRAFERLQTALASYQ
jgi:purine nucleosidase